MANKRMFSLSVVDTDSFLEMPISSRLLYYELGMRADDDGFVDSWRKILLFTGLKEDDMKILVTKKFVILFESGVIVIRHWRLNNYLRNDRYKTTNHQEELNKLSLDANGVYNMDTTGIPMVDTDKYSIDKNSIDKYSIVYNNTNIDSSNNMEKSLFDILEENGFKLSPLQIELVNQWKDDELTRYAIKKAVLKNKFNVNYVDKILNSYEMSNITTVEQAIESDEEFDKKMNDYYKNKYDKKENSNERQRRLLEEMCKDD